jgi:hypothetical protein
MKSSNEVAHFRFWPIATQAVRAALSIDPDLLATFVVNRKAPCCAIVITVEHVFYQCTKAIVRSKLWDAARHVDRASLPTTGTILADQTAGRLGGAETIAPREAIRRNPDFGDLNG